MSTTNVALDWAEEEFLNYDVSDEALETASGISSNQAGNLTLTCTFFYICPI